MSAKNCGIAHQIDKISATEPSILLWGDGAYDCELMALYWHESVLNLAEKDRFDLYCYENLQVIPEFKEILNTLPHCPEEYNGMHYTLIIHDVDKLSELEQARLLTIISSKFNQRLKHFRFILLASTSANKLIPELVVFFQAQNYHCETLSERKEDILPLAKFIIARRFKNESDDNPSISLDAQGYLLSRAWFDGSVELVDEVEKAITRFQEDKQENQQGVSLAKQHFHQPNMADIA